MEWIPHILLWLACTTVLGLGNTVGYHRMLTHRAFFAVSPVRTVLILLGATHSGSPVFWAGLHRFHHARSDTDEDPHSPLNGFWRGHTGWLIGRHHPLPCILFALSGFGQQAMILWHDLRRLGGTNPPTWRSVCNDLMRERLLRFLDIPMVMPALFAMQLWAAWHLGGVVALFGLWAAHLFLTNASWAVNSICHWPQFGTQTYDTGEGSRNVPWVAYFTNGEGYHNCHHRFPRSACHALHGGADLSWALIRLLTQLKLARDPWLPRSMKAELLEGRASPAPLP
jgi:fatty-acid desaturase